LFKTEPSQYSLDDLARDGRAVWDGVTNPLALKNLRQARKGDPVLIYHTGDERKAVGLARIVKEPYPDPKRGSEKLVVVDIEFAQPLGRPVALDEMKKNPRLKGFDLLRLGRLSIVPVSDDHWQEIMKMAGRKTEP
ncbi:MAG: EVE domain-containing protein, partial [Acidobacteria bacterium]